MRCRAHCAACPSDTKTGLSEARPKDVQPKALWRRNLFHCPAPRVSGCPYGRGAAGPYFFTGLGTSSFGGTPVTTTLII